MYSSQQGTKRQRSPSVCSSDFQKRHFSSELLKKKYLHAQFKLVRLGDRGGRLMIGHDDSMILVVPHNNFS